MKRRLAAAALLVALLTAACSSSEDTATTVTEPDADRATVHRDGGTGGDGAADDGMARPAAPPAPEVAASADAGAERLRDEADGAVATDDFAPAQQRVGLNAGWVDDNADFVDYLDFLERATIDGVTLVDISARQVITVVDRNGEPVAGATVAVRVGDELVHQARTHADGRILAFPVVDSGVDPAQRQPASYTATVSYDGEQTETDLDPTADHHEIALEVDRQPVTALDVLFLIDATGSMSDEIDRLKANMATVAEQIWAEQAQTDLRFAMVTYRDHGDAFLTRTRDFTADLDQFQADLDEVVADGGGDNPEALDEALHEAVNEVDWRTGEAVSLVFLVADAPPHLDDPQNRFDYAEGSLAANEAGIKVFPVASSGLDGAGEYVFRQVAQLTGAPFVFLTYGADGGPGTERPEFEVHDYSVLALDQLVVRLVTEEIAHQTA